MPLRRSLVLGGFHCRPPSKSRVIWLHKTPSLHLRNAGWQSLWTVWETTRRQWETAMGCSIIIAKIASPWLGTKLRPTLAANQPPAGLPFRKGGAEQCKSGFQRNETNPAEPHWKTWTSWRILTFYSEASDFEVFKMGFENTHLSWKWQSEPKVTAPMCFGEFNIPKIAARQK